MRSVIPLIAHPLNDELDDLRDILLLILHRLGYEGIWTHNTNIFPLIDANPLEVRLPYILHLSPPNHTDHGSSILKLLHNKHCTSTIIQEDVDKMVERVLELPRAFAINGNSPVPEEIEGSISYIYLQLNKANLTIRQIARHVGLSINCLERIFSKCLGQGIWQTVLNIRMQEVKRMLLETDARLKEIAMAVGIQDASSFSHSFKSYFGISATDYRQKNNITNR
jgi:AraC-like DNA-binding protein